MSLQPNKWSRNLSEENQNESNRMRLMDKQRRILESKRNRQQQITVTSNRQKSARSLHSSSGVSRSSDKLLNDGLDGSPPEGISNVIESDYDAESKRKTMVNQSEMASTTNRTGKMRLSKSLSQASIKALRPNQTAGNNESSIDSSLSSIRDTISGDEKLSRLKKRSKSADESEDVNVEDDDDDDDDDESDDNVDGDDVECIADIDLPGEIKVDHLNPLKSVLNGNELIVFATEPVPKNKAYQCTIIRDKRGIDRSFYPTYYIHLQAIVNRDRPTSNSVSTSTDRTSASSTRKSIDGNITGQSLVSNSEKGATNRAETTSPVNKRQVFLFGGRRRKKSKTYLIGADPFDISRDNCIAKLKSNVIGTQFTGIKMSLNGQRFEIVSIVYETNVLGFKGPRKMTVIIPREGQAFKYNHDNLLNTWKLDHDNKSTLHLKNKTPIWSEDTQSYVLNFHGRVTQASVKNFQLVHNDYIDDIAASSESSLSKLRSSSRENSRSGSEDRVITLPTAPASSGNGTLSTVSDETQTQALQEGVFMQFGRISDKEFTCDVTWPLSILQAFCIALSSFDSKLACE